MSQNISIAGPNLRGPNRRKGTFHIHAYGCADIKRAAKSDPMFRDENLLTFVARDRREIAEEIYDNGIMEDTETGEDYLFDFYFAPCVKLPVRS